MSGILPLESVAPTVVTPRISVFYGMPKVGKTSILSQLPECLILDTEGGAAMYQNKRLRISSIEGGTYFNADGSVQSTSIRNVINDIYAYGEALLKANKPVSFPYRRIAIDTLDQLEDMAEVSATAKYKESTIGKSFEGASVLQLANGAGYLHLRKEVMEIIETLASVCEELILITHVKDVKLDKGGMDVTSKDISLTGKLAQIVCAKADIIGYLFRKAVTKDGVKTQELYVSFLTNENNVMGSRFGYLAGKVEPFTWDLIFPPAKTV